MRRVVVSEFVSIDGVMEDPGGGEKTAHGGWSFRFWSDEAAQYKHDELFASDALLLGRKTYQGFADAWPSRTDDSGFAARMNAVPKFVVSSTLTKLDWNNSSLLRPNVAEGVRKLKQQTGQDILVAGSAQLVQSLLRDSLIDELRLMVHPIIVGGGKRLFGELADAKMLKLTDSKAFGSGMVLLTYQLV